MNLKLVGMAAAAYAALRVMGAKNAGIAWELAFKFPITSIDRIRAARDAGQLDALAATDFHIGTAPPAAPADPDAPLPLSRPLVMQTSYNQLSPEAQRRMFYSAIAPRPAAPMSPGAARERATADALANMGPDELARQRAFTTALFGPG